MKILWNKIGLECLTKKSSSIIKRIYVSVNNIHGIKILWEGFLQNITSYKNICIGTSLSKYISL